MDLVAWQRNASDFRQRWIDHLVEKAGFRTQPHRQLRYQKSHTSSLSQGPSLGTSKRSITGL